MSATEVNIFLECEIAGDSGRFEDALGKFLWEGFFDPAINKGSTTMDGVILY